MLTRNSLTAHAMGSAPCNGAAEMQRGIGHLSRARLVLNASKLLIEPAGRVRQHGVDLAGLRREIRARHHLAAVVARDLVKQALELGNVAIDRLHELAVGAIFAADLLERALALHGVELAGEHIALAALVAVPQLGRRLMVDHARDIDRDRIERLDGMALEQRRSEEHTSGLQ